LILTEVYPNTGVTGSISLDDSSDLEHWYPKVDGVRFNFVISNGASLTETSDNLSNTADRAMLRFIRAQSDLIITTGKTARAENLSASKYAPMLIITKSNEELDFPAATNPTGTNVYITQRLGTVYPSEKAIAIGGFQESVPAFIESFCRASNFVRPVLESGIETAKLFGLKKLIAEVDLTLVDFTNQDEAHDAASELLEQISFASPRVVQILRFEKTWFFRFEFQ
jgi:hypothetical protein